MEQFRVRKNVRDVNIMSFELDFFHLITSALHWFQDIIDFKISLGYTQGFQTGSLSHFLLNPNNVRP